MTRTILTIPTYRPEDIARTVRSYSSNFHRYGHDVPIIVFDDSDNSGSEVAVRNLNDAASQFRNGQELFYVGPREKRQYLEMLVNKLGEGNRRVVEQIFRPSYGGNRNFILVYTLGEKFVSVDDDLSPEGIFSREGLGVNLQPGIVSAGRFMYEKDMGPVDVRNQDIVSGYEKFLGSRVSDHTRGVCFGSGIEDLNVDSLGITDGSLEDRVMRIIPGSVSPEARVKVVQSHLTGDADIDSADLVNLFMETGIRDILAGHLPKKFVADGIKEAVTDANSRLTCAVLGYDNSEGGIYFLPTNFRCEDFIWRSYLERTPGIAVAYTGQAQTHRRALSVRSSIAQDWFNELIAQRIKRRIRDSIDEVGENTMTFHEPYPVSLDSAYRIRDQIREKRDQALRRVPKTSSVARSYKQFAGELDLILSEIVSPQNLRERLTGVVMDELGLFNETSKLWPSILEESARMNGELPQRRLR